MTILTGKEAWRQVQTKQEAFWKTAVATVSTLTFIVGAFALLAFVQKIWPHS